MTSGWEGGKVSPKSCPQGPGSGGLPWPLGGAQALCPGPS